MKVPTSSRLPYIVHTCVHQLGALEAECGLRAEPNKRKEVLTDIAMSIARTGEEQGRKSLMTKLNKSTGALYHYKRERSSASILL